MNIKSKKIVLYGTERLKLDFAYLFPKAKIVGYITDSKIEARNLENFICTFKQINKNILKHKFLVLCLRKDDKLSKKLKSLGLIYKLHYCYFEDLGYLLNDVHDILLHKYIKLVCRIVKKWKLHHEEYYTNEEMLNKMIYTDSVDGYQCTVPFKYVHVEHDGFVSCCCPRICI